MMIGKTARWIMLAGLLALAAPAMARPPGNGGGRDRGGEHGGRGGGRDRGGEHGGRGGGRDRGGEHGDRGGGWNRGGDRGGGWNRGGDRGGRDHGRGIQNHGGRSGWNGGGRHNDGHWSWVVDYYGYGSWQWVR